MTEHITVSNYVATLWRDGERVGEWQAGPDEYAAAGQEWPGCTCVDAYAGRPCRHGLAHYWGEGSPGWLNPDYIRQRLGR